MNYTSEKFQGKYMKKDSIQQLKEAIKNRELRLSFIERETIKKFGALLKSLKKDSNIQVSGEIKGLTVKWQAYLDISPESDDVGGYISSRFCDTKSKMLCPYFFLEENFGNDIDSLKEVCKLHPDIKSAVERVKKGYADAIKEIRNHIASSYKEDDFSNEEIDGIVDRIIHE